MKYVLVALVLVIVVIGCACIELGCAPDEK
jgi:hypothetical protein